MSLDIYIYIYIYIYTYIYACTYTYVHLYSPTSTGGSHASEGKAAANNLLYDYADPAQIITVPHQPSNSGELYAVSSKVVHKRSEEQLPREHYDDMCNMKNVTQGVSYN